MSNVDPGEDTPVLNDRQYRGLIERFAIFGVALLFSRFISPELQAGVVSVIVPMMLAGIAAVGGIWFNRNDALIVSTAALPEVKNVEMATKAAADAIPVENVIPPIITARPQPLPTKTLPTKTLPMKTLPIKKGRR